MGYCFGLMSVQAGSEAVWERFVGSGLAAVP